MTRYVKCLVENDLSFKEFVQVCAKNFGAAMHMTNDELSAPLRLREVSHNHEEIDQANEEFKRLVNMSDDERDAYGESKKDEKIRTQLKVIDTFESNILKVSRMRERVESWEVPAVYEQLKSFMLDQLHPAIFEQYLVEAQRQLTSIEKTLPGSFYNDDVSNTLQKIQLLVNRQNTVATCNTWISDLLKLLNKTSD